MCKVVFGIGISISQVNEEAEATTHKHSSHGLEGTQENPMILDEDPQPSSLEKNDKKEIIKSIELTVKDNAPSSTTRCRICLFFLLVFMNSHRMIT